MPFDGCATFFIFGMNSSTTPESVVSPSETADTSEPLKPSDSSDIVDLDRLRFCPLAFFLGVSPRSSDC